LLQKLNDDVNRQLAVSADPKAVTCDWILQLMPGPEIECLRISPSVFHEMLLCLLGFVFTERPFAFTGSDAAQELSVLRKRGDN
jgi:hypothetical protein